MLQHLGDSAPHGLLELLGQFARYGHPAPGAEHFGKLFEAFHHPVGRFIKYHRTLLVGERLQLLRPPLFLGQEPLETKPVAREAALHKGGDERRGTGQGLDLDAGLDTSPDEQEPRVGDTGCPGVRNQRGIASGGNRPGHHLDRGVFVELVVRMEFFLDTEVSEQERRSTRILGEDEIHLTQHIDRPQRDIVEVPDRRRYDIELGHGAMRIYVRAVPSGTSRRRNWHSRHNSRQCRSCSRRNRRRHRACRAPLRKPGHRRRTGRGSSGTCR